MAYRQKGLAMLKITRCPTCGSSKIQKVRRDWTDTSEGETYTVPDLEFWKCSDCGEELYGRDAMRKIEAHSPAFATKASGK